MTTRQTRQGPNASPSPSNISGHYSRAQKVGWLTEEERLHLFTMRLIQDQSDRKEFNTKERDAIAEIFHLENNNKAVDDFFKKVKAPPLDTKNGLYGLALILQIFTGLGIDQNALKKHSFKNPHLFQRGKRPPIDKNGATTPAAEYNGLKGLLHLIQKAEHDNLRVSDGRAYNTALGNKDVNFTSMTIDEVLQWQKGRKFSAAGAYQIINKTLKMLKTRMSLTGDELFDKNMQDRMAIELLKIRGLGKVPETQFAHNLSKEWASLPKDESGLCYYENDGVNMIRSHFSFNQVRNTIHNINQEPKIMLSNISKIG